MKHVVQLERTGCGIAAVAAVAGVSYRHAQRTANGLGIFASDCRLWSETGHVRRLLREYCLRPASIERPFRSWKSLPDLALLAKALVPEFIGDLPLDLRIPPTPAPIAANSPQGHHESSSDSRTGPFLHLHCRFAWGGVAAGQTEAGAICDL